MSLRSSAYRCFHWSSNFNPHFVKYAQTCTFSAQAVSVGISIIEMKDRSGTTPQMAILERAGLVRGSNTTAVIRGMVGALGPLAPRLVRRYELTDEGRKYLEMKPGMFGQNSAFCYGHKTVDSIIKWTEPTTMGPYTQSEVTYSYKIVNLAGWAQQPGMQQAFPDIRSTLQDASKPDQIAGLVLTNKGWKVPEQ